MGIPLVVAHYQRRAPGHAGCLRADRPVRVRGARHHRAWRASRGPVGRGRPAGRAGRAGRLHVAAGRGRRLPGRPVDHAARPGMVPGGDRGGHRDDGQAVAPRPAASRCAAGRPDLGLGDLRDLGPGRADRAAIRHRRRPFAPRFPLRHLPRRRDRRCRGAGVPDGLIPVGIGVYGTTGRLEKGYRAYGAELEADYNLVEAGMSRPRVKPQPFTGKDAYLRQRAAPPCAVLCTLTVDDHRSAAGQLRYMLGGEPILTQAGERLVDAKGRPSYVTSAGCGPSVGKHLLMAYLPAEQAREGNRLAVEYMAEQYPVTVAVAGSTPLFDPENSRVRS